MVKKDSKNYISFAFVLVILMAFLGSGCAVGTTRLKVAPYPLNPINNKKQGNILVKQFVDNRKVENLNFIGNKRNGFGMVLGHVGMEEGVKLDLLFTKCFADALHTAGYNTVVQYAQATAPSPGQFDAIVTGEITEFWMDLYMAVWHKLDVKTKALNPVRQNVLWEKRIEASDKNVLWIGATSEFERIVNTVLTNALNQAAQAYASDEFFQAIRKP